MELGWKIVSLSRRIIHIVSIYIYIYIYYFVIDTTFYPYSIIIQNFYLNYDYNTFLKKWNTVFIRYYTLFYHTFCTYFVTCNEMVYNDFNFMFLEDGKF